MLTKEFPQVHYYDQDFVDIYDRSWAWMQEYLRPARPESGFPKGLYVYPESPVLDQVETVFASFSLVYFNKKYPVANFLDNFYARQEENGAIRWKYDLETGKPVITPDNPEGLCPPLLAWGEYNLYHKVGQKVRVKNVMPHLVRHHDWMEETFKDEATGLYAVPPAATLMDNSPRNEKGKYFVDFNTQMALNALFLSSLADVLNDKDLSFRYKRQYFSLKTRINGQMWDQDTGIYYDLDAEGNRLDIKTIAAFWPLLAEMPNEERAEALFAHLRDPKSFGTMVPFPTLSADHPDFDPRGDGARGGVYPPFTFMVIKGLEKYEKYDFAREAAIKHMYNLLDTFHPDGKKKGTLWESYRPDSEGPMVLKDQEEGEGNRRLYLPYASLATIAMTVENIVGLYISLPRKTVDWIVPTLELMGIQDLPLRRNKITILSNKSGRGWEIRLESEKLYYFTVNLIGQKKKKTLPIPSGKCSMLIDKL